MTLNDCPIPRDPLPLAAKPSFLSVACGYIFASTAMLTPSVVFFENKALVPIAILTTLSGLAVQLARGQVIIRKPCFFQSILIVFLAWALISSSWADLGIQALVSTFKLVGNCLLIFTVCRLARGLTGRELVLLKHGLFIGFTLLALIVAAEVATNGSIAIHLFRSQLGATGLFWVNRSALTLAIMLWPIGIVLLRTGRLFLFLSLGIGLCFIMIQLKYGTGTLSVLVSMTSAAFCWYWSRLGTRLLSVLSVMLVILMPLGVAIKPPAAELAGIEWLSNSAMHRLHIWDFATKKLMEHPVVGWGMNMARSIPGGQSRAVDQRGFHGELLPLHPHNAPLQIWLELGFVGAVLAAVFLGGHIWRLNRFGSDRRIISMLAGQTIAVFVGVLISFGIWQGWLLALIGLTSAWSLAMIDHTSSQNDRDASSQKI